MESTTYVDGVLTHKMCGHCKVLLPVDCFTIDRKTTTGLRSWCRTCQSGWKTDYYAANSDALKEYTRQWVSDNHDRKLASDAQYRADHQDELRAYFKDRYWAMRDEMLDKAWVGHIWRSYKLTKDDYLHMLESQGFGCAICGTPPTGESGPGKHLHVDHDHDCCPTSRSCGLCVRRLLCVKCNMGLGSFQDDIELLRAAVAYLEEFAHIKDPQTT